MTNANTTFNRAECTLIKRARRIRERAFAFDLELGAEVARLMARGWKRAQFVGMADAFEYLAGYLEGSAFADADGARSLLDAADWIALELACTTREAA